MFDDEGRTVRNESRFRDRLLRPRWHIAAVVLVWLLFAFFEWFLSSPIAGIEYVFYLLSAVAFVPFALLLTNFGYHFLYAGELLPRVPLENTNAKPSVAVCYTTYNDIIPLCLEQTATAVEYPVDYWVLSDSDDDVAIEREKAFEDGGTAVTPAAVANVASSTTGWPTTATSTTTSSRSTRTRCSPRETSPIWLSMPSTLLTTTSASSSC